MDETPSRLAPKIKAPTFNFIASEGARVPSFEAMDRLGSAAAAKFTQGISPHALYDAWFDWASHLLNAPGRLVELGIEAVNIGARLARFAANGLSEHAEPPSRRRPATGVSATRLEAAPYALWQQAFSLRKRGGGAPPAKSAA
jgi:polyhydroxyalkanoate synthase